MIEILTPAGFQSFKGIGRYWHDSFIKFTFDDDSIIECAFDHRFIVHGNEVFARNVLIGDNIGKVVKQTSINDEGDYFYDPLNVENGSVYCHDGSFVSHNSFVGSSNTLIASDKLLGLQAREPVKIHRDVNYYSEPKEAHNYVMMIDVSRGRGQDYSTFTIVDISSMPFEQVATFRDNMISPLLFPDVIVRVAKTYNNAIVVIESNDAGQVVCNSVYHEYEYENTFVESTVKAGGVGVTMTKKVKRIGCSNLKDLVESGKLIIHDLNTIHELSSFEHRGDSFQASNSTHDDMVMNLVLFSWFVSSEAFGDISTIDLKQLLYSERMKEMEEDVPLFGVFGNSQNHINPEYEELVKAQKEWGTF